ncbi:MAG: tRNA (adenosine(37)-N6)-threonylcarbamoyltransferase complex ATPase subunit type 1 TsaE [Pseudomonadota bacterium]
MIAPPFILKADLTVLQKFAEKFAAIARSGDVICLSGDLGSGKTTFARAFLRAMSGQELNTEIPSPSFSLVQAYETQRFVVSHYDFYRINEPSEVLELGLDDAMNEGVTLIEWPEKASEYLPEDYINIVFHETSDPEKRRLILNGYGRWYKKLQRFQNLNTFLQDIGWGEASQSFLQGDASARAYIRLRKTNEIAKDGITEKVRSAILMDAPSQPDGPPIKNGQSYSQIACLAEDMHSFVAVGAYLREQKIYAPEIYACDLEQGFLLIEDLGHDVFGKKIAQGADILPLYRQAVDVLLKLREANPDHKVLSKMCGAYALPECDACVLNAEIELLLDWYWPAKKAADAEKDIQQNFLNLYNQQFEWLVSQPRTLVLRDFHSPNLLWCEHCKCGPRVGVIDFQDAIYGHEAYDLVSLLQDARLDVPEDIETELLAYYCTERANMDEFDRPSFMRAYALLGAQRNTKILGIFARLARRDSKPIYLQHIPRIWRYLERNLKHVSLCDLQQWYNDHFPKSDRQLQLDDITG